MKTTNGEVHPDPVTSLPSTYSVHEFHNYGFHGTGVSPTLHFHLAASINARTDIPLVPTLNASHPHEGENQLFVVHWLDNKEMQFTQDAERIMDDLFRLAKGRQDLDLELSRGRSNGHHDDGGSDAPPRPPPPKRPPHPSSKVADATSNSSIAQSDDSNNVPQPNLNLSDMLDHRIDQVLKDWHQSSDLLFAVHPVDGSFLVWVADFLDEYQPGSFRQAQVSFSSRIPNALPLGDAITMGTHVELFNGNSVLDLKGIFGEDILNGTNEAQHDDEKDEPKKEEEDQESSPEPQQPTPPTPPQSSTFQKYKPPPIVSLISKHSNGTLNLWNMMFAEKSKFAQLLNVSHNSRASGHRFRVNGITCHPVLPLLLTTSHHNLIHESEGPISAHEEVSPFLEHWFVDKSERCGLCFVFRFFVVSSFCGVWIQWDHSRNQVGSPNWHELTRKRFPPLLMWPGYPHFYRGKCSLLRLLLSLTRNLVTLAKRALKTKSTQPILSKSR